MVLYPKLGFNVVATLLMLRVSGEPWQVRAQEWAGQEAKHIEPTSECWLPGFVAWGLLYKDSPCQAQFSSRVRGFSSGDWQASSLVAPCVVHHLVPTCQHGTWHEVGAHMWLRLRPSLSLCS